MIADFTSLNLVVSDSVTGNITLHLDQVPWDQALETILNAKGLGKRQLGNVNDRSGSGNCRAGAFTDRGKSSVTAVSYARNGFFCGLNTLMQQLIYKLFVEGVSQIV